MERRCAPIPVSGHTGDLSLSLACSTGLPCACTSSPGADCIKIGLPGKFILRDYFQENRTSGRTFLLLRISFTGRPIFIQFVPGVPVADRRARDELYKNRSSGKTDSQEDKRSLGSPILLKIVFENKFSGKTYFYTIGSRSRSTRSPPSPTRATSCGWRPRREKTDSGVIEIENGDLPSTLFSDR